MVSHILFIVGDVIVKFNKQIRACVKIKIGSAIGGHCAGTSIFKRDESFYL